MPDAQHRAFRRPALYLAIALAASASAGGQTRERFELALGAVKSISTRPGVSDAFGMNAELSLPVRTLSTVTFGLDLGGVEPVTGEVVCEVGRASCDGRELSAFGYASLSARWELQSRITPLIRVSAGEWTGRTTSYPGFPRATEHGFTGATEVGLRVGRIALAARYRVLGHTLQGRMNQPAMLLGIAF